MNHATRVTLAILVMSGSLLVFDAPASRGGTEGTAHDFSDEAWGSGQSCQYCHVMHEAENTLTDVPLWNHETTTATFDVYASNTLDGTIGQPSGVSKMCLSCHDGTVAIDSYAGGSGSTYIPASALIDPDLTDDHPLSVTYEDAKDTGLRPDDGTGASVSFAGSTLPLYANRVECSTCHNVHDDSNGKFLRISNAGSALCLVCHNK
ncbi:MAG: cytochrome c3 family protein [Planctomycetota bacterium]